MIDVKKVETKKELEEFVRFPWRIYQGNPYWVPPLISEVKEILDTSKNPFWEHAYRELFLARKEERVVGRIVSIVDDNHNKFHNEKTGFFGFFESIDDNEVALKLLSTAEKWVKEKGMTVIRGPVNPSLNDECAFLLEGFDKPPVVMMPYTPAYYLKLVEQCGYYKAKDLLALLKKREDGIPKRIVDMVEKVRKKLGVKIRPVDLRHFDRDIQILKEIYNSAWERNWGFVPMTDKEMDYTARKLKTFVDPDVALFAEVNDKPIGVVISVPDINQILIKLNGKLGPIEVLKFLYYKKKVTGVRSLIGGVKKEYRNTGIIALLYYETEIRGRKKYEWSELGWNLEDNDLINRFDMAIGGKIYKKYRIYEKKIE